MDEDTPLDELEVLLLDCQASGASPKHGEIIDVAWSLTSASQIRARRMAVEGTLVALEQQTRVPRRVKQLTGISTKMLADAPTPAEVAADLGELLRSLETPVVPVAHYARFERPFIHGLLERVGLEEQLEDYLCTHAIAQRLMPGLPRRGLRAIAGYFGEMLPEEKRAEVHVLATAVIWREIVELLMEEEEVATLGELRVWLKTREVDRSARREFPLARETRLGLPVTPGVYKMLNRKGEVLYVGKATSLKQRVNSYFRGKKGGGYRKLEMATQVWDLGIMETITPLEAALLESDEIKRHAPPYNKQLRRKDREVWFSSTEDLTEASTTPSPIFDLGPFGSPLTLEALRMLIWSLDEDVAVLELFHTLEDTDLYLEGLALLRERRAARIPTIGAPSPQDLLALGEEIWLEYLASLDEKALEDGREEEVEEEDEAEVIEEEEDWTPEGVCLALERLISRVARYARRGAFMLELFDATVCWQPPHFPTRPKRVLVMEAGEVLEARDLQDGEVLAATSGEQRHPLERRILVADVDVYDRLSVLLTELRRIAKDATEMTLLLPGEQPMDGAALAARLRMI
ncbi:MAG: GIY-YIG nuclease family protein [Myxococcota bacterium]|nr:GIY-YIG nuclease family protein [Myxococcota bacterium]MEC9440699.1 GIY-YIG nuclease family protein [Myxococcota bacterium]